VNTCCAVICLLAASIAPAQDAHVRQGVTYFQQEQYAKALEEFQQAHAAQPNDASVDNLIGIAETKLGQIDEGNRYYKLAIGLDPRLAGPYKNLAVNYLSATHYDLAEQVLKQAEVVAPQDPFVHYYLAEIYLDTSRDREAVAQLEPARALIGKDPDLGSQMAAACLRVDMKTEATELISNLESGPGLNVEQEYRLGILLAEKEMYPAAVERFRRIVQRQPASWTGKFDLAVALIDANELPEAIAVLEPLTSERSSDARLFTLLGAAYEATGDYPEALKAYASAVRNDPDNSDLYLDYTRLLMDLDRYGEAAQIVQQGMKNAPDAYALNLRLGSIDMTLGQYDQARQLFQKAIDQHPDIALGYVALAQAYMRDGKDADAAKLLADVRGKLPPDAMLEYMYGLALSHLSQNDEAVSAFRRSVALDPKVAESHYELGKLYFQLGQIPQAREEFQRVIAIAPDHANAHYQLSRVYARLGETANSREMAAETQVLLQRQRGTALQAQKARLGDFQAPQAPAN
jgi:tetratricopeptide (TPR) repeat protein